MPLIDDEAEIAQAITGAESKEERGVDVTQLRRAAAALCPEWLAHLKNGALALALLAMGEKEEGLTVLTSAQRSSPATSSLPV